MNYHLYTPAHVLGNWNKKLEDADSYPEAEYQVIEPEPVEAPHLKLIGRMNLCFTNINAFI